MQFEYKTLTLDHKQVEDTAGLTKELNRQGTQGWELATTLQHNSLGPTNYSLVGVVKKTTLLFKRAALS